MLQHFVHDFERVIQYSFFHEDDAHETTPSSTCSTSITSTAAYNEHRTYAHVPFWSSLDTIRHHVGATVYWLFVFSTGQIITNGFLGLCGLAVFIYHSVFLHQHSSSSSSLWEWLTFTYLDPAPHSQIIWYVFLSFTLFVTLLFTILYYMYVTRIQNQENVNSEHFRQSRLDDPNIMNRSYAYDNNKQVRISLPLPIIKKITSVHRQNSDLVDIQSYHLARLVIGRLLSGILFCFLLGAQVCVNYVIYRYSQSANTITIILLSIMAAVFNLIWMFSSQMVTKLEQHVSLLKFYSSMFLKTYIFRIASTLVLFSLSYSQYFTHYYIENDRCPLVLLTQQHVLGLGMEVVSSVISNILVIIFQRYIFTHCCKNSQNGQHKYMPGFILVSSLADLLYKQFLMLLGVSMFPLMPLAMTVILLIERFIIQYRLLRLSRPVRYAKNSFKTLLIVVNCINTLLAVFVPPYGVFWLMKQPTFLSDNPSCTLN